ncbi:MAG: hypothetical protein LBP89_09625 [Helicobacteraceae bacterium]|jgi:hypothetical protein|nr:hypothetical protein [Helicobacteraceae bacterium]
MKRATLLLGMAATLAFGANVNQSLLVGKTWTCETGAITDEQTKIKVSSVMKFNKSGAYESSGTINFISPEKYAINTSETGNWKLKGDKLFQYAHTVKATSKEKPDYAKMIEAAQQFAIEGQKKLGENANEEIDDYVQILELTNSKLTFKNPDKASDVSLVCKAK